MIHHRFGPLARRGALLAAGLSLVLFAQPAPPDSARGTGAVETAGVWRDLDDAALREDFVTAFEVAAARLRRLSQARGWNDPATLDALHEVTLVAHLGGDQDTADTTAQLALNLRERVLGPRHIRTLESRVLRGLVAKYANDHDLARACYTRVLAEIEPRPENFPLMADALTGLANVVRLNHGTHDDVLRLLRRSLDLREQAIVRGGLGHADNLVWLGWTLLHAGYQDEALRTLDEAERMLTSAGLEHHSLMGVTWTTRADLHVLRGEWARAEELYRRGLGIFARCRSGYLPGFGRRKLSLRGYDDLAAVQLHQGREDEAWRSLQKLRNNVSLDLAALSRWSAIDPPGYARARELRAKLARLEPPAGTERAGDARMLPNLPEHLVTLAELRRLEHDHLARNSPPELDSDTVRRALPPGTAYVGWLHTRPGNRLSRKSGNVFESAWMYVLRRDAPLRWVPLWHALKPEEAARRVDTWWSTYRRYMSASEWPLRVAPDPGLDDAAHEVYTTWFAPALPYLDGVDRLIVEFSTEFPRVPLESLLDDARQPLGKRFAFTYVPSATTYEWLANGGHRAPLRHRPALALGGSIFSAAAAALGIEQSGPASTMVNEVLLRKALDGDPTALDQLPTLPYSLEEARVVASLFPGSTLLAGAEGSEKELREIARSRRLTDYGVIHLATHVLSECHPERSALALSRIDLDGTTSGDGLLRSREVLATWELDADLLVLSGCQSARSCGWDEGEYVGFTQALMAVGATSVVASLWKVDDRATAMLMTRFYENLTGRRTEDGRRLPPLDKDLALAEAKLHVREFESQPGVKPFSHPAYWSGFVLFGPGS